MQSKILIITLVTMGMFAYTSAQCQPKQPIDNYIPEYLFRYVCFNIHGPFLLVRGMYDMSYIARYVKTLELQGKFYLVAAEKAFSYQDREARCTSTQIEDPSLQTFPYVITYQDNNGTPQTIIFRFDNISPPGAFNVTGADGVNFEAVMLGAIQDKVTVFYACNAQNNRVAVWIYYYTRVQGFDQMDADTQRYVRRVLANNNIPRNDLQDVDNSNCNNN